MAEPIPSPVAVESGSESDSESDRPEATSWTPMSGIQNYLTQLRAPRRSDLTRKRKVRQNSVVSRKRKPSCSSDPRSVTPLQRVREFADEALTVSAGKLFCTACREELSLKQSIIKGHVKTSKHLRGKKSVAERVSRQRDIAQALKEYDQEVHPAGETLPVTESVSCTSHQSFPEGRCTPK